VCRGDLPGGLDAIHLRHPDVHQYDVGPGGSGLLDSLSAVGGFAYHLDAILGIEEQPEA
jgi:hypothetical protein